MPTGFGNENKKIKPASSNAGQSQRAFTVSYFLDCMVKMPYIFCSKLKKCIFKVFY